MHCVNNAVIMQTEQLGRIETLKEKLLALEGCNQELERKLEEQDCVISNLVGDNLDHLQDNMCLTAYINSSSERMVQLEHRLGQVGSVLMGMIEGAIEREGLDLLEAGTSDASGDDQDDQGGDMGNGDAGASLEGSTRVESPMPREGGLIAEMEREAMEAGAGGWFNGVDQEVPESWSGCNSIASASQDQMGMTLLTTIGGRTLPNPVRVPDNMMQPAVLRGLMEGPVRPWQCLVWLKEDPPEYSHCLPPSHTSGPSHVLLQIGLSLVDVEGEYRGGVIEEELENEGGGASVE